MANRLLNVSIWSLPKFAFLRTDGRSLFLGRLASFFHTLLHCNINNFDFLTRLRHANLKRLCSILPSSRSSSPHQHRPGWRTKRVHRPFAHPRMINRNGLPPPPLLVRPFHDASPCFPTQTLRQGTRPNFPLPPPPALAPATLQDEEKGLV